MKRATSAAKAKPPGLVADEKVLILDFGSQYAQLIARRVREQHVYCEIVRHDITAARIRELAPRGIILSGGPASVYDAGAPKCDPEIFRLGIPVLGICYGLHLACEALGGKVDSAPAREFGRASVHVASHADLFDGVPDEMEVWMSHGDQVSSVSAGFVPLAATKTCPIAAVKHAQLPIYGLQFHPEVTHTPLGAKVLGNFLTRICGCSGAWQLGDFAEQAIEQIRRRVGSDRVICGLSGGVDSSVVAALIYRAIGPQLVVHLGRQRPVAQSRRGLGDRGVLESLSHRPARGQGRGQVFAGLGRRDRSAGKAPRIGHAFIDCFSDEAAKIQGARFLAQGTLYPDVIESGAAVDGPAATIKLHHNVGGLPADLSFRADRAAARPVQGRSPRAGLCNWACPTKSSGGIRSRVRGWRSAAWAK